MVNDYERQDFWKKKIKIKSCGNKESWYYDKIGNVFEVNSTSVRDYYVYEKDRIKCVLINDAEIVN